MSTSEQHGGTHPEVATDRFVLWTMAKGDEKPHPADSLDISKPCVFFFGGGAYIYKGEEGVASQRKSMQEMLTGTLQPANYNFYTITNGTVSDKKDGIFKTGQMNQAYNDDPRRYYSMEAESFVKKYIAPLAVDLKSLDKTSRSEAIETTAKHFSAITMLGYSYGTAFVQEISNALSDVLGSKGYNDTEKATVMKSLAAVNIGPTFQYTNKYPDIAQTTLVLSNDKDAVRHSGIHLSNPELEFTCPGHGMAYMQGETHTLIYSDKNSTRVRSVSYRNPAMPEVPIMEFVKMVKSGKYNELAQEEPCSVVAHVVPAHNKQLQTATFGWQLTPESISYTYPSNMVGIHSVRFLREAVHASDTALKEGKARDAVAVNNRCVAENLSREGVHRDALSMLFYQRLFDRESGALPSM